MKAFKAYAPASIGNVSLGFDVLGAALAPVDGSKLGDEVDITAAKTFSLEVTGSFAHKLPEDINSNIVTKCYHHFCEEMEKVGKPITPVTLKLHKNLPIGSGLGSSASSIVAAFAALNVYFGNPFDKGALLTMMGELEGQISGSVHYDNVAPCFFGGMTLMTGASSPVTLSLPLKDDWYYAICYSGISVSTAAARDILPKQVDMATSLAFGRQLGVFVHALHIKDFELAASVMKDVIAEPYRKSLLPGFDEARAFSEKVGALAFGISGSGPTVFAVCPSKAQAEEVSAYLSKHYVQNEDGFSHVCQIPQFGTRVTAL